MKKDITIDHDMLFNVLYDVQCFEDKLYNFTSRLKSLKDTLEDLQYYDNLDKFNENGCGYDLKANAIYMGNEFKKLCDQKDEILRELKKTYVKYFLQKSFTYNR